MRRARVDEERFVGEVGRGKREGGGAEGKREGREEGKMEWMEKGGRGKGGGTGEEEIGEEKEKRKETWRKRKRVDRVTRGAWRRKCGKGWEDRGNEGGVWW